MSANYDPNIGVISAYRDMSAATQIAPKSFKSLYFDQQKGLLPDTITSPYFGNLKTSGVYPEWKEHWDYKGTAPIGESALVIPPEKDGGTLKGRMFRISLELSLGLPSTYWEEASAISILVEAYYFDDSGNEPVVKEQIHYEPVDLQLVGPYGDLYYDYVASGYKLSASYEFYVKMSPLNRDYKQYLSFIVTNRESSGNMYVYKDSNIFMRSVPT